MTILEQQVNEWDMRTRQKYLTALDSAWKHRTAWLVAHSGDSQWWLILGLFLWLRETNFSELGFRIVLITVIGGVLVGVLKRVIRRKRPPGGGGFLFLRFDKYAFPSGHATRVAAIAIGTLGLMPLWFTAILLLWGIAVDLSRIALGAHYPSDIVGGSVLGVVIALVVLVLV